MIATRPLDRGRTKLHVVNEVLGTERVDWVPKPIEVILCDLALQGLTRGVPLEDFPGDQAFAIQLQPCEDATLVFRVVAVGPIDEAEAAIHRYLAEGGTL